MQDLRFALRQLLKHPGFTAVAVISLALGIGAGTAVFSLANAILLRSLPVPNPHELRVLRWTGNEVRMTSLNEMPIQSGHRLTAHAVTHPAFLNLREQCAAQADIFGFQPLQDITARARSELFTAQGMLVSDNFFSGLGVRPVIGRGLDAEADSTGAAASVVIAYDWWERHFALDPGVLGQTVTLNATRFTIVGVLPRGCSGVLPGNPSEFYVPMSASSPFLYRPLTESFHWFVRLMARLRPGVSDAQLRASLEVVFAREAQALMNEPRILVEPGRGGLAMDRNHYRRPLGLMLGVVGLVMLVACANLAGLSLARGAARQHEWAVRAALGAGRWRLIRQSLTESLLLAWLGGGFGVLLAVWGKTAISRLLAGSADGLHYDLALDLTVLGFAFAVALVTALLSGLLPAWRASRADPLGGLKSRSAFGAPRLRVGKALVAAQICLSLLLLTGAGLYVRTLLNLTRIDAGFRTDKLLLVQVNAAGAGYEGAQRAGFYEQVRNSLATIPGVRGATVMGHPLLANQGWSGDLRFTDGAATGPETMQSYRLAVGDVFFETLGIPVLQGRALGSGDLAGAPKVVVVNEAFVRAYSPGASPLGRSVRIFADWHIVGVCRDAKLLNLKEASTPIVYFPLRQISAISGLGKNFGNACLAVRTALPPLAIVTAARKAVAAIDPNVPLGHITTQDAVRDRTISQERLLAALCGALAALAVLLACIGLYGLMAYNVARRTGEIGIRMALGATRRNIAAPILREAVVLAGAGVAVGVPVALALSRLIESQLYGVKPNDPLSFAAAAFALVAVAAVAAWVPARCAANVEPMTALRAE